MRNNLTKTFMKVAGTTALCGMFALGTMLNFEKADARQVSLERFGVSLSTSMTDSGSFGASDVLVRDSNGNFTVEKAGTANKTDYKMTETVTVTTDRNCEVQYSEDGGKKFKVVAHDYDESRFTIKISPSVIKKGKTAVIRVTDGEDYADANIKFAKLKSNSPVNIAPTLKYEKPDTDFPYGKIVVDGIEKADNCHFTLRVSNDYDLSWYYQSLDKTKYENADQYSYARNSFNEFMCEVVKYGATVQLSCDGRGDSSFYFDRSGKNTSYTFSCAAAGDCGDKFTVNNIDENTYNSAINTGRGDYIYYREKTSSDEYVMRSLNLRGIEDQHDNAGKITGFVGYFADTNNYYKITKRINNSAGDVDVETTSNTVVYKMPKLKIKAQPAAPNVIFDGVKGTINTKDTMEYSYRLSVSNNPDDLKWHDWLPAAKNMKIADIKDVNGNPVNAASGASIRVRVKATGDKMASRVKLVKIPAIRDIETSHISITGTLTEATLKADDYDKDKNPYEYTTTLPTKDTKWTALKGSVTFKGKTALTESTVIYVRKAGTNFNAKKGSELRRASLIAIYRYDKTTEKWVFSGTM